MALLTTGLELWLYGRRSPANTKAAAKKAFIADEFGHQPDSRFTKAELDQIRRTIKQSPEVFIKVSSGGKNRRAVKASIAYIGQSGGAEIETDRDQILSGKDAPEKIVDAWDVDLVRGYNRVRQSVSVILGMPAGTSPDAIRSVAKEFAREQFSPNWRWCLALHTNAPNPHVHIIVKTFGHDGTRLHIDRETIHDYRLSFAEKLRARGIDANATMNAARGKFREPAESHALFQINRYSKSQVGEAKAKEALRDIATGKTPKNDPIKEKLQRIRAETLREWAAVQHKLEREGHHELAADVGRFVARFQPVKTEREKLHETAKERLREHIKNKELGQRVGKAQAPERDEGQELTR